VPARVRPPLPPSFTCARQAQLPPWALSWHTYLSSLVTGDRLNYAYLEAIVGTISAPTAPAAIAAATGAGALASGFAPLAPLRLRPLLLAPASNAAGAPAPGGQSVAAACPTAALQAVSSGVAGQPTMGGRLTPVSALPPAASTSFGMGCAMPRIKRVRDGEGEAAGAATGGGVAAVSSRSGWPPVSIKRIKAGIIPGEQAMACEE
jgi:hypothetical protein